jgi:hypothetical protein
MIGWLMKAESETIWKEAAMTQSMHYPEICLEWLRKVTNISVRLADVAVDIGNKHLPKTSQEHCRLDQSVLWSEYQIIRE